MSVDRLFEVKNAFYLGNYQQCINEAQKPSKSDAEKQERQIFLYRAYISQKKPTIVLSEVPENSPSFALRAVRRLAEYQNPAKRSKVIAEIEKDGLKEDDTYRVLTATVLLDADKPEDALRVLHEVSSLEAFAARIQTILRIDRVDVAVKELAKMAAKDEDATITQLATAWVNLSLGRDKLKDAFYIYQEMMDKYGATPYLLVGQSTALIMQEQYEEAEKLLQEAQTRDANYADAIINLITVSAQTGKAPEVVNRLIAQMKDSHPEHAWSKWFMEKERFFDNIASSPSIQS